MQRSANFRLSSHSLPIVTGCFAGQHMDRADRVCCRCVADEMHVVIDCLALQPFEAT